MSGIGFTETEREIMEPKWSKPLVDLSSVSMTVQYDPTEINWPEVMAKQDTITVNGVSVPIAITDVKYENGDVSASLVFAPEDYAEFKKAYEGTECQSKSLKLK
jgi:hypothetical protein